jgi:DNA-binding MarR family transcriptional regulator
MNQPTRSGGLALASAARTLTETHRLTIPLDNSRYNVYISSMARGETAKKLRKDSCSLERDSYLSIQRTADLLARAAEEAIKPSGLSGTQYNVLRILRGAGPGGLCCREVAERMITRDPDITRLLDRLEARGLIVRARDSKDRRIITVRIAREGLRILAKLDEPMEEFHRRQLGHLGERRLKRLIDLLNFARVTSG